MQFVRLIGVSVSALAMTLAGPATAQSSAPSAGAQSAGSTVSPGASAQPGAKSCFSNLDGGTGVAIVSQDLSDDDASDSAAADDFTLDAKCRLKTVTAVGQYFIGGPADSETVTIYTDKNGKPGRVKTEQTVVGMDNAGTFQLSLDPVRLKPGTYWVSVVANLAYAGGDGGLWGWETTSAAEGGAAVWQNPQDGYGTGCTTWDDMQACIGGDRGGDDFLFALN